MPQFKFKYSYTVEMEQEIEATDEQEIRDGHMDIISEEKGTDLVDAWVDEDSFVITEMQPADKS